MRTRYPLHTLALDPRQLELELMPATRRESLHLRPGAVFTSCCPCCAMVHVLREDYLACVQDRAAVR